MLIGLQCPEQPLQKKKVSTSQCFHGYHGFVLNINLEYYSVTFAINLVFVFLLKRWAVNASTQ